MTGADSWGGRGRALRMGMRRWEWGPLWWGPAGKVWHGAAFVEATCRGRGYVSWWGGWVLLFSSSFLCDDARIWLCFSATATAAASIGCGRLRGCFILFLLPLPCIPVGCARRVSFRFHASSPSPP